MDRYKYVFFIYKYVLILHIFHAFFDEDVMFHNWKKNKCLLLKGKHKDGYWGKIYLCKQFEGKWLKIINKDKMIN